MIGSSEVRISENVTVATSETNEKKINKERKGERVCREGSRGDERRPREGDRAGTGEEDARGDAWISGDEVFSRQ